MIRRSVLALALVATFACGGSSPLAPTSPAPANAPIVDSDPRLEAALAVVRTRPGRPAWTSGATVGEWFSGLDIAAIRMGVLRSGIVAEFDHYTRVITINRELEFANTNVLAGFLIHEARHAEGYRHSCGELDRRSDVAGAWETHAAALDWMGEATFAATIRASKFCN